MTQYAENTMTLGTFLLDDLEFGVDLLKQREVLQMMPVTRMPCGADFLEGVITIRGTIIPVVNLRARFGLPRKPFTQTTRIVNIEVTDTMVVGFIVDSVGQVRRLDKSMLEPTPPIMCAVDSDFIVGMGKFDDTLLLILDIPKILSAHDIESLERHRRGRAGPVPLQAPGGPAQGHEAHLPDGFQPGTGRSAFRCPMPQ